MRRGPCRRSNHAWSWRGYPDGHGGWRRSARLVPAGKGFDDEHVPAAAGAWRPIVLRLLGRWFARRGNVEKVAGQAKHGLACGAGEQAVTADAMEASRQDVRQEAADELVGRERHHALTFGAAIAWRCDRARPCPVQPGSACARYRYRRPGDGRPQKRAGLHHRERQARLCT